MKTKREKESERNAKLISCFLSGRRKGGQKLEYFFAIFKYSKSFANFQLKAFGLKEKIFDLHSDFDGFESSCR